MLRGRCPFDATSACPDPPEGGIDLCPVDWISYAFTDAFALEDAEFFAGSPKRGARAGHRTDVGRSPADNRYRPVPALDLGATRHGADDVLEQFPQSLFEMMLQVRLVPDEMIEPHFLCKCSASALQTSVLH